MELAKPVDGIVADNIAIDLQGSLNTIAAAVNSQ